MLFDVAIGEMVCDSLSISDYRFVVYLGFHLAEKLFPV
jgi:hypothetical protein